MEQAPWFAREEDWVLKQSIIFNKQLVRLTFLEVSRLLKLLGNPPEKSKLLDLCCGIGRHSLEFARNGFEVTGVDITKSYIEKAAAHAAREQLDIEFVHSDMRDFQRPGYFDVVANLCTSFGYFDDIRDDLRVLENIYQSLRPGGKFMIEILGKEVVAASFQPEVRLEFDGYKVLSKSRILENWNRLECIRTITKDNVERDVIAYHRLYSATELQGYLQSAGFRNIKVYGNFAGAPYDNQAKSMIMVGER